MGYLMRLAERANRTQPIVNRIRAHTHAPAAIIANDIAIPPSSQRPQIPQPSIAASDHFAEAVDRPVRQARRKQNIFPDEQPVARDPFRDKTGPDVSAPAHGLQRIFPATRMDSPHSHPAHETHEQTQDASSTSDVPPDAAPLLERADAFMRNVAANRVAPSRDSIIEQAIHKHSKKIKAAGGVLSHGSEHAVSMDAAKPPQKAGLHHLNGIGEKEGESNGTPQVVVRSAPMKPSETNALTVPKHASSESHRLTPAPNPKSDLPSIARAKPSLSIDRLVVEVAPPTAQQAVNPARRKERIVVVQSGGQRGMELPSSRRFGLKQF
jgi:hypothetical protein